MKRFLGVVGVLRRKNGVRYDYAWGSASLRIKKEDSRLLLNPLLGGDYLRLPMPLTIVAEGLRALSGGGKTP